MKKILLTMSAVAMLAAGNAHGQLIVFSGTDGSLDLDLASGSVTQFGLELTLSANNGEVNATTAGLGINDAGTGDDTNGLDTINLVEVLTFSFDKDVTFNWIDLADVGSDDGLQFSFNGNSPVSVTTSGVTNFNTSLLAGQTLTVTAFEPNSPNTNNGVTIESFQVTAVPEPTAFAFLLSGMAALALRRRRA